MNNSGNYQSKPASFTKKKLYIIIAAAVCVLLLLILFLFILYPGLAGQNSAPNLSPQVRAVCETRPVPRSAADDAADDPAIWINKKDPASSTIIGTDKKGGLAVYDLRGMELFYYPDGAMNNVDLRYGFILDRDTIDIAAVTNRTNNTISLYRIHQDGSLAKIHKGLLKTEMEDEVYGLCMYEDLKTNKYYVFINNKFGIVEQWELYPDSGLVNGKIVRKLKIPTQVEGMAADDELGFLYVGEEDSCIWKFNARPDAPVAGSKIAGSIIKNNKNIKDDIEGIAIYAMPGGKGYVIASSQGNDSYAFFKREEPNDYLGSIHITDGIVDGTEITDGIDATSQSLGDKFPHGLLVVQDGTNKDNGKQVAQNFKLVNWDSVAFKLKI